MVGLAIMAILSLNFVSPDYVQSYSDDVKGTATKVMTSDISDQSDLIHVSSKHRTRAYTPGAALFVLAVVTSVPLRADTELIDGSSGIVKSSLLLSKLD